jgi:hypothetical protein
MRIRAKPPPILSRKVLERRRAQLRVARRVLDRSMAGPILNPPRAVAGVGQRVAAGVTESSDRTTLE